MPVNIEAIESQQSQNPDYLFAKHGDVFRDFGIVSRLALQQWLVQSFRRASPRTLGDIFAGFSTPEGYRFIDHAWDHVAEGLQFVLNMELGDRATNGVMRRLLETTDDAEYPFSRRLIELHAGIGQDQHHNHNHTRRVEMAWERMVLHTARLRHDDTSVVHQLDAMHIYDMEHDWGQLWAIDFYRNHEGKHPNPKKAHGLAGGLMAMAFSNLFAEERGVRKREGWEHSAMAAAMIAVHPEPELLQRRLHAHELTLNDNIIFQELCVNNNFFTPEDIATRLKSESKSGLTKSDIDAMPISLLSTLWDSGSIDVFLVSPFKWMELFEYQLDLAGMGDPNTDPDCPYFNFYQWMKLNTHSIKEDATEISIYEKLQSSTAAIIRDPIKIDRTSFSAATEAVVWADMLGMIAPPYESLLRTFLVQYSINRSFWSHNIVNLESLKETILRGPGNVDGDFDHDVRRILWELFHADSDDSHTVVDESKFAKDLMRESRIMTMLFLRNFGNSIMRGDSSDVDQVFKRRIYSVTDKALRKSGVRGPFRKIAMKIFENRTKSTLPASLYGYLPQIRDRGMQVTLDRKIEALLGERADLMNAFRQKPDWSEGRLNYDPENISQFNKIMDWAIGEMARRLNILPKELRQFEKRVIAFKYPKNLPYRTYDSLGGMPRVIFKSNPETKMKFERILIGESDNELK